MSGLATRLYRGEAGVDVVGKRKVFFGVAGAIVLIAILSFIFSGFRLGIEFEGGTELRIPASVGTLDEVEAAVTDAGGEVVSTQQVGGDDGDYLVRMSTGEGDDADDRLALKTQVAEELGIPADRISDSAVSGAWGKQIISKAGLSLLIFIGAVVLYLIFRFEWRMAVAAIASLLLDLLLTAGVYSLVGFEVTPSTVIGFLTILGFALYDVVVVFDKVQENTRGITGSSTMTYPEAANLAVNQTLMRSINTGLVALLPVGGLLFIGAGLLGAGTLKDLGLVLFFGMGAAVYSSIFFATPVLVELKTREPKYKAHTQRVLARRAGGGPAPKATGAKKAPAKATAGKGAGSKVIVDGESDRESTVGALAASGSGSGSSPRPGARPSSGKRGGGRGGRPGHGRPSGSKRR
jgi:preprotein translocase subunit SecF